MMNSLFPKDRNTMLAIIYLGTNDYVNDLYYHTEVEEYMANL